MTEMYRLRGLRWCVLLAGLLLAACSTVNYQPLPGIARVDHERGYRLRTAVAQQQLPDNAEDLFVVMMFSGGGTRAAALGYGVLDEMRRLQFDWHGRPTRLFDQVDLTFGVSGGSMLSAYYALQGEGIFDRFERQFLRQNVQGVLARQVFAMRNWPRLGSPEFGRGDLLEEQLDQALFHGATYADLLARRKGPFTVISATDMSTGQRLDFMQETFDVLCLDLPQMPVARAVAASSAVPLVFAPLTLNNNGGNCNYHIPQGVAQALMAGQPDDLRTRTRSELVEGMLAYSQPGRRPFLHLLDGGLTDNLGLRTLLDIARLYTEDSLYRQLNQARHIVFINVNAQTRMDTGIDHSAAVPGTRRVLESLVNIPIDKNSQEALRQFRVFADEWRKRENQRASRQGVQPAEVYFISLALEDVADPALRAEVIGIPTSLYLPPQQIHQLKQAGTALLNRAEEFARLRKALGIRRVEARFAVSGSNPATEAASEAAASVSVPMLSAGSGATAVKQGFQPSPMR